MLSLNERTPPTFLSDSCEWRRGMGAKEHDTRALETWTLVLAIRANGLCVTGSCATSRTRALTRFMSLPRHSSLGLSANSFPIIMCKTYQRIINSFNLSLWSARLITFRCSCLFARISRIILYHPLHRSFPFWVLNTIALPIRHSPVHWLRFGCRRARWSSLSTRLWRQLHSMIPNLLEND